MIEVPLNIAVEDALSEAVVKRLIQDVSSPTKSYSVGAVYRKGGNGYLKKTIGGWNSAAKSTPILVLTDLDISACAPEIIATWIPGPIHPNLIFRVAIREVEAWLLADAENLQEFLRVRKKIVVDPPESIRDPKAALISLARNSRSAEIRNGIPPRANMTAKQGPLYNILLEDFVRSRWNVTHALQLSDSLARAHRRLRTFMPQWR